MLVTIQAEQVFQTINGGFTASPSAEGYTLNYSSDGISFSPWKEATPAGEVMVVCVPPCTPIFWKLVGNNSTINIQL